MSIDQPDYTRLTTVNVSVDALQSVDVKPKGGIIAKGSETTTASYATIASRTVTTGKTFQVSKITISAEKASYFKYRWDGTDISSERLMDDKTIVIEHFPKDYYSMVGDGAKIFDVQAKYETEAGVITVEIVGEEETT